MNRSTMDSPWEDSNPRESSRRNSATPSADNICTGQAPQTKRPAGRREKTKVRGQAKQGRRTSTHSKDTELKERIRSNHSPKPLSPTRFPNHANAQVWDTGVGDKIRPGTHKVPPTHCLSKRVCLKKKIWPNQNYGWTHKKQFSTNQKNLQAKTKISATFSANQKYDRTHTTSFSTNEK